MSWSRLLKKKDCKNLKLKADNYVVKTNVHFPTDLNLLWDAARKCIELSCNLAEEEAFTRLAQSTRLAKTCEVSI